MSGIFRVDVVFCGCALLGLGPALLGDSAECLSKVAGTKSKELLAYVQKKFKIPETVVLSIRKDEQLPGSCYRALTIEGKASMKTWEMDLYLSPDQRFLASELLDTQLDPVAEERRKNESVMDGLTNGNVPTIGQNQAPVTIVEFSDFECPFCKRFANMVDEAVAQEKGKVRVVFRHFPLASHPWARAAAEGAACAQLQGSAAFWLLHNQLFAHQEELTVDNVTKKLFEYASTGNAIDANAFKTCIDNQMSLGLVYRDIDLATANKVNATPTLFVNGHRLQGVKDASELKHIIHEAAIETETATRSGR